MKKFLMTFFVLSVASLYCNAQLRTPVQSDTLFIKSMQYHYEDIRLENWPFTYIVRKAQSYVFGDQEFIIEDSFSDGIFKYFKFRGSKDYELRLDDDDKDALVINFAGYILVCSPKKNK